MSREVTIRFENVTKRYVLADLRAVGAKDVLLHLPTYLREWRRRREFTALDSVSFEIRKGECFGIIGRNGSGKSTTLGLMAGVLRPTTGAVETSGHICPLLELGAGFHYELSGRENILLNGILLGMTREQVLARMADIIAFSELGDFIERPIRVYSSGMVARLGFSVVVHLDPDILLIDEVLAVGDTSFQDKCLAKMTAFREVGVTMVYVSHSLESVKMICDRAALLDEGRLVTVASPEESIAEYYALLHRLAAQGAV